jgi:uncharacterized protein YbjT (DUF2867 family)
MAIFAVLGVTGRTGGATARALLKRGHAVRALTRNPDSTAARGLSSLGATLVHADMSSRRVPRPRVHGYAGRVQCTTGL